MPDPAWLAGLAWPVLAFVVAWRLWPLLRGALQRGTLTVKFGDMEISVQEASEGLRSARRGRPMERTTILWVDDRPESIAVEIATLEDRGVDVVHVPTPADALRELVGHGRDYAALITDMARTENGVKRPKAGIGLITEARRRLPACHLHVLRRPERGAAQGRGLDTGADGITASPLELLAMIQRADTGRRDRDS